MVNYKEAQPSNPVVLEQDMASAGNTGELFAPQLLSLGAASFAKKHPSTGFYSFLKCTYTLEPKVVFAVSTRGSVFFGSIGKLSLILSKCSMATRAASSYPSAILIG